MKVISGKSRGHTGRVMRVDPKSQKVWVEGANIQVRHTRPRALRGNTRGPDTRALSAR